ncbi:MAG: choice-of-anchor D domain-containing protein, partial [Lentisphaerota bacterium]
GATTTNVILSITDDSAAEGPEAARFTLVQARGARVAGYTESDVFIRDNDSFMILTANLAGGTNYVGGLHPFDVEAQRLLKLLRPDIVSLQEWRIPSNMTYRAFVDDVFGADYSYYLDTEVDVTLGMPNGIVSRWPITASNEWTDAFIGYRDHLHAKIDLPSSRALHLVSVHFAADPFGGPDRISEAMALTNYIANAGIPSDEYLVISGDLNLSNRTDTCLEILKNMVSDARKPTDRSGDEDTNVSANKPFDVVLPNAALESQQISYFYNGVEFTNGMIHDTRLWSCHEFPALGEDTKFSNATHRPVMKVFSLNEAQMHVFSTNGTKVVDGDTTPTAGEGTDFGSAGVVGGTVDRVFVITNWGSSVLAVSNAIFEGANPGDFAITAQPASSVAIAGSTTFTVRFDPIAAGTRSATLVITNNTGTNNPYNFAVSGDGLAAMVSNNPTTLSFTTMVGVTPASQGFGVTNAGQGTLTYAITTNYITGAGWINPVTPGTGTAAPGAGNQHTVNCVVSGMTGGVYTATISVTDTNAGNSPQSVAVSLTVTNIPDPASAAAGADGNTMVRLSWVPAGSLGNVIILHKNTTITTDPAQGASYSLGSTIDGASVIFSGTVTTLEHIVPAGSENYYKFYTVNNNHYSTGAYASVTMGIFADGEMVEPFSYTNGASVSGLNGSNGWAGAWAVPAGTWTVVTNQGTATEPFFPSMPSYPANAGNKLKLSDPGNGGMTSINRSFPAVNAGVLYISYMVAYAYDGGSKWAGMSWKSNTTEKIFIGEAGSVDHKFGISDYPPGQTSTFDMNPWSGGNAADTGNVYLVVGKYTFATREFKGKAFYRTTTVPDSEPASWDVTDTLPADYMNSVDSIVLKAGCSDGGATIGECYFDEVRIATSWKALVNQSAPVWDGGGADALWDTAANWEGNVAPSSSSNITFYSGLGSGTNINLNGDRTVAGLTFNSDADTAVNIRSNALTINGQGIVMSSGAAGAHVIESDIALGTDQSWTNDSAAALKIKGVISGAYSLTKQGLGVLTLANSNNYEGSTVINAGTVLLEGAASVAGSITVSNSSFESPYTANYTYTPAGPNWAFVANSGVARTTFFNPAAPAGSQGAFCQRTGAVWQTVSSVAPGLWTITFASVGRAPSYGPNQMKLQVDNVDVLSWTPGTASWTYYAGTIYVASVGAHILKFVGTNAGTDLSSCVDDVSIAFSSVQAFRLPTNTPVLIASGAVLDLGGVTQPLASLANSGGGGGTVKNTAAATSALLTLNADSGSTTFSGSLVDDSGTLALTKAGKATQIFTGVSTNTGSTTVSAGVMLLACPHARTAVEVCRCALLGVDVPAARMTI